MLQNHWSHKMHISCPNCCSHTIRKNGSIHTGKQKCQCASCSKQFVENPQNKMIPEETKERIHIQYRR
jgi:transposase-like protein